MSDPTGRALALLSLLQARPHWRGSELASRLDVSDRTVRRDVDRLRSLGYPVDAAPGIEGGYRLAVGANVPPLLFDDDEATALVVGLRMAAMSAIEGVEDTTVALMAKLDQMLPDRLRRRIDALQNSLEFLSWSPVTTAVPVAALTVLSQGCRNREEVRFDYERRDGEPSRRLVQPYHLVSVGRRWYLVAWDVRRDDWRLFRVDRMEQPALAGARFDPRPLPGGDPAAFVRDSLRARTVEYRATVIVADDAERLLPMIRWFEADVDTLDAGRTRLVLRAESYEWLASMIAIVSTGADVDVVDAPEPVLDLLADAARRLAAVSPGRRAARDSAADGPTPRSSARRRRPPSTG